MTSEGDAVLEQNKSLIRRFVDEMVNKGNPAIIDEVIASNLIDHDAPPDQTPGPEGVRRTLEVVHRSFHGYHR